MENLTAIIEAILFVSGDPVRVDVLAHAMNLTVSELEEALNELRDHLALENRGIQLNRSGALTLSSVTLYCLLTFRYDPPVSSDV